MGTKVDADLPDVSRETGWLNSPILSAFTELGVSLPTAAATQPSGGGDRGGERPEEAV